MAAGVGGAEEPFGVDPAAAELVPEAAQALALAAGEGVAALGAQSLVLVGVGRRRRRPQPLRAHARHEHGDARAGSRLVAAGLGAHSQQQQQGRGGDRHGRRWCLDTTRHGSCCRHGGSVVGSEKLDELVMFVRVIS
jgi:hypothetical protein